MKSKKRKNSFGKKDLKVNKKFSNKNIVTILRHLFVSLFLVSAILIVPLSMVWKQAYITNSSMGHDALKDSLDVLNRKISNLVFRAENLSSTDRIERIAKEFLKLDYPQTKDIVIVHPGIYERKSFILRYLSGIPFWSVLKRSMIKEEK